MKAKAHRGEPLKNHNLGSRVCTQERRKQRMSMFVDQLKCGTRGKHKTSQASDYVLISMWEWLHTHDWSSRGCELCKRDMRRDMTSTDALSMETVAHIQSAGCKAQKKSVIGAHNRCWTLRHVL
jgi:hypothetical protein